MKRRNDESSLPRNNRPRRSQRDDFDVSASGIFDVCDSPDLSPRIMGRLGYMRVSPNVARRRRRWLWISRSGIALASALAFWIGASAFEHSPEARRAHDITVPAAIGNDVRQHQNRIGNVINLIRNLAPPATDEDPQPDQSEFDEPQLIDFDVAQPAWPFRWV